MPGGLTAPPSLRPARVAALFVVSLLPVVGTGCGDPCGDLQEICDLCVDPNQKAACEASVDDGADDVCEQDIDSYGNVCL